MYTLLYSFLRLGIRREEKKHVVQLPRQSSPAGWRIEETDTRRKGKSAEKGLEYKKKPTYIRLDQSVKETPVLKYNSSRHSDGRG